MKIVEIENCSECPHYDYEYYNWSEICCMESKKTPPDGIPEWCPLPDVKEEEVT